MIEIRQYKDADAALWDKAVLEARNGTFLLSRPYMDYHRSRFRDASLMIYADSRLAALLPAAVIPGDDSTVASHPGLTYGGLILADSTTAEQTLDIVGAVAVHYKAQGFRQLLYSPVPHIYHRLPSEDDIYALWRHGARLERVNLSSAFRTDRRPRPDTNTLRNIRRGSAAGLICREGTADDLPEFHALLTECLADRHNAEPVHSLDELQLLAARFPDNIRLYLATAAGAAVAAVLAYITPQVTHTQYIATNAAGRDMRALPVLFEYMIGNCNSDYFDFGTSNEDGGHFLNAGLMRQKRGEGGRPVIYPSYILPLQ